LPRAKADPKLLEDKEKITLASRIKETQTNHQAGESINRPKAIYVCKNHFKGGGVKVEGLGHLGGTVVTKKKPNPSS